ncbi:response regulator [Asticcacaulis sp.]|uniref:response regulator n=1 Tax=Asticcacaulis sp. TaxID=1872648 RepID=UPI003F7BFFE7
MNAAPRGHALRILTVDDNRETALSLKDAVEDFGDTAFVCFKGNDALELAASIRPDVILLDLSMPDIDGVNVARILRADARLAGVKIIAVTAYGDAEARQKTAAAGFDLHLTKPVRFDVLSDMLDLLRLAPKS